MAKLKPLINYYGGKARLASKIIPHLKAIPHTVRGVPFAGGLSVFYAWEKPEVTNGDFYREFINDIDGLLINLYRTAKRYPVEFEQLIQETLHSQSEHQKAIEICKNPDGYSDLEKAWGYYVNITQSFIYQLNSCWSYGLYGRDFPKTLSSKKQTLADTIQRLQDTNVSCEDALKMIKRIDSPQTLLYLDPPYPNTDQGYYKGYSIEDYKNLCELLDNSLCSYVLSCYPQDIEPKSAQKKVELKAYCSASSEGKVGADKTRKSTKSELGDRKRTELLLICDRSDKIRPSLSRAVEQVMSS